MPIAVNQETGEVLSPDSQGQWAKTQTAVNPETKEMLALDGQEWKPVPAKGKGVLGFIDDAARSIAQGVTFGFADEIGAKVNPAISRALGFDAPETEEAALAQERARDAAIPAGIDIPGQIAGAIGSTVLAAPAVAAGAARAGLAALPKALQFAGLGAAEGAVAGAGTAEDGNRLEGAAAGGASGLVVGGSIPVITRGVAGLFNRIKGALSPTANVSADLGRAIARDADSPATIQARAAGIEAQRPGVATIADAGGENVRGLVERVAQTPGAGRTKVIPALTGRQKQQAHRIGNDLKQLTGTSRTAFEAINETVAKRTAEAGPIYRSAFAEGDRPLRSSELDRLLGSDLFVKAMRRAVSSGKDRSVREGFGAFNPKVRVTDDGRVVFQRGAQGAPTYPNLQYWDQVKRELDQFGGKTSREGLTATAEDARGLARLLRTELDKLTTNPETGESSYKAARSLWAGDAAYLDAIEQGRGILSNKFSAEEMQAAFAALGQGEQEAFRAGAVSSIIARMGNDASKLGDMTKFIRSPEMRAKLSAIMPTREAAEAWAKRLEFEVSSSELTGQALGNSATARRLAERADAEGLVGDLVMDALAGAGSVSFLRRTLTAGPKWLRDTIRSKADGELADVLTNPKRVKDLDDILTRAAVAAQPVSGLTNAAATAGGVSLVN